MTDATFSNGDTATFANGDVATFGHSTTAHVDTNDRVVAMPSLLPAGVKPVGPVEINWDHPLAEGLEIAWMGESEIASNSPTTFVGTSKMEAGSIFTPGSSAGYAYAPTRMNKAMSFPFTVVLQFVKHRNSSANEGLFTTNYSSINYAGINAYINSSEKLVFLLGDGGGEAVGDRRSFELASTSIPLYELNTVAITFTALAAATLFWNGQEYSLTASGSAAGLGGTNSDVYAGVFKNQDKYLACNLYSAFVWDGTDLTGSLAELTRDPYQFLKPATPKAQIITTPTPDNDRVWVI